MIRNLLDPDDDGQAEDPRDKPKPGVEGLGLLDDADDKQKEPFILSEAPLESPGDTIRKSGLAWSAGVAMFSSIVFMLVLGWLVDLLIGTSPWGIVFGIVLGSLIGFIQLFRISSQIFRK